MDLEQVQEYVDMLFIDASAPRYTLVDAMRWYLDHLPVSGPQYSDVMLIQDGDRRGFVNFNYNRRTRLLIIQHVALVPAGGNIVHKAALIMVKDPRVAGVVMEQVLAPEVQARLRARGWELLSEANPDTFVLTTARAAQLQQDDAAARDATENPTATLGATHEATDEATPAKRARIEGGGYAFAEPFFGLRFTSQ